MFSLWTLQRAHFTFIFSSPFRFVLGLFVFLVLYHGRQVEIASSLDFLWKQQARYGTLHTKERLTLSLLEASRPCKRAGS